MTDIMKDGGIDILPLLRGMIPALHKGIRAQDAANFLEEFNKFIRDSGYFMWLSGDGLTVGRHDGGDIDVEKADEKEYDIDTVWGMIEQAQRWLRDVLRYSDGTVPLRERGEINACRQCLIGAWQMLRNLKG